MSARRAVDLALRHAVGLQKIDFGSEGVGERVGADAGAGDGVEDEQVGAARQVERRGARVARELPVADEALVQTARVAEAQHGAGESGDVVAGGAEHRRAERQKDTRQHDVVGHDLAKRLAERRREVERRQRGLGAARRDRAEVALDERLRLGGIEVAGDRQHGVVGRVPGREELADVLERRGVEVLERADERVVERVLRRIRQRGEALPPGAVRLVVDRPAALVLHDVALGVELLLRHRREQPAHAVGLEPERDRELVRRHGLEVVRAVEPGRPVQRPAGTLHELEVLVRRDVRRSLEEHVLEQVREAGASGALVRRADVIPEVDRDERRGVVFRQGDAEAIRKTIGLERDAHPGSIPAAPDSAKPMRRGCVKSRRGGGGGAGFDL